MFFGGYASLILTALFCILGGWFIWRFFTEMPQRRQDISDCRDRLAKARKDPAKDTKPLQEELRGTLLAYALVCAIALLAALYVLSRGLFLIRPIFSSRL